VQTQADPQTDQRRASRASRGRDGEPDPGYHLQLSTASLTVPDVAFALIGPQDSVPQATASGCFRA